MGRGRRQLQEDEAELGRRLGTLERVGYKDLVEEVRAQAKAEGKNVTEKLAEIIKAGLNYEKYSNLTLADAFKVLDFIERAFNNFFYPVMYATSQIPVEQELEKIRTFAQYLGFVPKEKAEELARQKAIEYVSELAQQEQEQKTGEQEQKAEGPITIFIKRLSEKIAEKLGDKVIEVIEQRGELEDFINMVAGVAEKTVKQTIIEEAFKGGEGEQE